MTRNTPETRIALVLAGHGSHIAPETAGLVWSYVDQLRAWGVADEITACFWKEPPAFSTVLDTLEAETVVVVPVFTAQGYFTSDVIPAEMGISGEVSIINGKTVHYTRTIGDHPYLTQIVKQRVTDTLSAANLNPSQVAAAVIGHGTRRSSKSRDAARYQAGLLREAGLVAEVADVYLDDDPDIPSVYTSTQSPNIIAVPYFLAPGSHVTIDVPDALGIDIDAFPAQVDGRTVYYTPPVGTDDAICRLILELARDTGLPFEIQSGVDAWHGFPHAGRDAVIEAVHARGELRFGQLLLRPDRVTHIHNTGSTQPITAPAELRRFVREEPFRPLPTSDDLPSGWHVDITSPEQLHAVVETVYPEVVAQWEALQRGALLTESLETVAARQQGTFKTIDQLAPDTVHDLVTTVCGRCTRMPNWYLQHEAAAGDTAHGRFAVKKGTAEELTEILPCKTACNFWLSTAAD